MLNKILFLLFCICIVACAHPSASGRESPDAFQRSLTDLRSIQAELTAQQSQTQEELRNLAGRVEELEFRLRGRVSDPSVSSNLQPVMPRIPNSSTADSTPNPIMRPPTQDTLPPALANRDTPPPIVPLNELTRDEEIVRHLDAQFSRTFTDALYFVRRGEFRQALTLLDDVISISQGKDGHAQALFWKGVCNDGIGNNRDALMAYNSVISRAPDSDRARLALLRLASVFVRLGDTATAKVTLQKLIAEAPASREAEQARLRLKDL